MATERHLWVNLASIGEKKKGFLLDAPVLPSELFGTSIEETKARMAAFITFIPRQPGSAPKTPGGPGSSWAHDQR